MMSIVWMVLGLIWGLSMWGTHELGRSSGKFEAEEQCEEDATIHTKT